ncbi:MAG: cell envelope integrity protein TolA [Magnetococcales bacterium]|nr:cell envelope integrity protein TolA [Magnetococcales bacterium]
MPAAAVATAKPAPEPAKATPTAAAKPVVAEVKEPAKKNPPDNRKPGDFSDITAAVNKHAPAKPAYDPSQAIAQLAAQQAAATPQSTAAHSSSRTENVSKPSKLQMDIYQRTIQSLVRNNWIPSGVRDKKLVVTVSVKVTPDGQMSNPKITRSSGNSTFDRSVLNAILKTNNLPPPPAGLTEDDKWIEFNFDNEE